MIDPLALVGIILLAYVAVYMLWVYPEGVKRKEKEREDALKANGKTRCWFESHHT